MTDSKMTFVKVKLPLGSVCIPLAPNETKFGHHIAQYLTCKEREAC